MLLHRWTQAAGPRHVRRSFTEAVSYASAFVLPDRPRPARDPARMLSAIWTNLAADCASVVDDAPGDTTNPTPPATTPPTDADLDDEIPF